MAKTNKVASQVTSEEKKVKLPVSEKEQAVIQNILEQFDRSIKQFAEQIKAVEQQRTVQLQLMAQVSAAAAGHDFTFAQYTEEEGKIILIIDN